MIYKGLNRTGKIESVKAHGGADVTEVYGGINEVNPIYYKTRTITGQTPLSYKALSKPLSDYLISGNAIQDGTPTPDYPVDVQGCGVRTENLFEMLGVTRTRHGITFTINNDKSVTVTGAATGLAFSIYMGDGAKENDINVFSTPIFNAGDSLIFSTHAPVNLQARYTDGTYSGNIPNDKVITLSKDIGLIYSQVFSGETPNYTIYPMIRRADISDSTYEPYGYKLPLTVNGAEYPIYLGKAQTTRRIKKFALTGSESGWKMSDTGLFYNLTLSDNPRERDAVMSTHFEATHEGRPPVGTFRFGGSEEVPINILVFNYDDGAIGLEAFKSWIAAQYANGTPVTVWYIPVTPETGIVNEPLMKIGNYADTISLTQAGVTIPTVAGANDLTVDTTVLPSEVSVTGNIKEVST